MFEVHFRPVWMQNLWRNVWHKGFSFVIIYFFVDCSQLQTLQRGKYNSNEMSKRSYRGNYLVFTFWFSCSERNKKQSSLVLLYCRFWVKINILYNTKTYEAWLCSLATKDNGSAVILLDESNCLLKHQNNRSDVNLCVCKYSILTFAPYQPTEVNELFISSKLDWSLRKVGNNRSVGKQEKKTSIKRS